MGCPRDRGLRALSLISDSTSYVRTYSTYLRPQSRRHSTVTSDLQARITLATSTKVSRQRQEEDGLYVPRPRSVPFSSRPPKNENDSKTATQHQVHGRTQPVSRAAGPRSAARVTNWVLVGLLVKSVIYDHDYTFLLQGTML